MKRLVTFVGKFADWKRLDAVLYAAKEYEAIGRATAAESPRTSKNMWPRGELREICVFVLFTFKFPTLFMQFVCYLSLVMPIFPFY